MPSSEPKEKVMERLEARRFVRPEHEGPVSGETAVERSRRSERNRRARKWWDGITNARCAECGEVRFHVSHETDPATSPEGTEYHADFAHHPFVEPESRP